MSRVTSPSPGDLTTAAAASADGGRNGGHGCDTEVAEATSRTGSSLVPPPMVRCRAMRMVEGGGGWGSRKRGVVLLSWSAFKSGSRFRSRLTPDV